MTRARRVRVRRGRLARRVRIAAVLAVTICLAVPGGALAWITRTGGGDVLATADGMPAGIQPAASMLGRNVQLRWVPGRFNDGVAVRTYNVRAARAGSASTVVECAGTVAVDGLVEGCSFDQLAPGTWTFAVQPVQYQWAGAWSSSTEVSVGGPSILVSPTTATEGSALTMTSERFLAGETIAYRWGSSTGPVLATAVADALGSSSVSGVVPAGVTRGTYSVHASASPSGEVASASITIANRERSSAPVASDDEHWTTGFALIPVLANDTDPDGDILSIASVGKPRFGTAVVQGRVIAYTPPSGFRGDDSFTYAASDGKGGTSTATVRVIVAVNTQVLLAGGAPWNVVTQGGVATASDVITESVASAGPGFVRLAEMGTVEKSPPEWVFAGQALRLRTPVVATAASPHVMTVRVWAGTASAGSGGGKGGRPRDPLAPPDALFGGRAVAACAAGSLGSATERCVQSASYEESTNNFVYVVRTLAT